MNMIVVGRFTINTSHQNNRYFAQVYKTDNNLRWCVCVRGGGGVFVRTRTISICLYLNILVLVLWYMQSNNCL